MVYEEFLRSAPWSRGSPHEGDVPDIVYIWALILKIYLVVLVPVTLREERQAPRAVLLLEQMNQHVVCGVARSPRRVQEERRHFIRGYLLPTLNGSRR